MPTRSVERCGVVTKPVAAAEATRSSPLCSSLIVAEFKSLRITRSIILLGFNASFMSIRERWMDLHRKAFTMRVAKATLGACEPSTRPGLPPRRARAPRQRPLDVARARTAKQACNALVHQGPTDASTEQSRATSRNPYDWPCEQRVWPGASRPGPGRQQGRLFF